MSKLEKWFAAFGRELWMTGTNRAFALWEVALLILLIGKRLPWWAGAPVFLLWMLLRSVER